MKDKTNKLAIIFVVSIFALTSVATGYAMWSQDLTIYGDVSTGTLDWCWVQPLKVEDTECPPPYYPTDDPDGNCDPNFGFIEGGVGWGPLWYDPELYPEPKNVACGELEVIDCHTLAIVINYAYPGYWNGVQTHVFNYGTIPIKIQEAVLSWDPEGTDIIAIINEDNEGYVIHIDLDGDDITDMELIWGDHFGDQLHGDLNFEISWQFCFLQNLKQNAQYIFYVTLTGVQWNEYVEP